MLAFYVGVMSHMDNKLLIVIVFSELVSLILIFRHWATKDFLILKILITVVTLFPLVGPVFFFFIVGMPKKNPKHLIDKPNATDCVDRGFRANYTEYWQQQKPILKRKIEKLKNRT